MSYHGNTKCRTVKRGEMCEGDGECGSDDDANNCATQYGTEPLKDVYLRVPCRGEVGSAATCSRALTLSLSRSLKPTRNPKP